MTRLIYILLFLFCYTGLSAQESVYNVLQEKYRNAPNDSTKLHYMIQLIDHYGNFNTDSALILGYQSEKLAISLNDQHALASAELEIARLLRKTGDYKNAMIYLKQSLKRNTNLNNRIEISKVHSVIGIIYYEQSNFVDALKHYLQALKIYEELENKNGVASIYNNLGLLYKEKGSIDQALKYYLKSLAINKLLKDSLGLTFCYNNLGVINRSKGDYRASLDYFNKALKINNDLGNTEALASSLYNIGITLNKQGHFDNALKKLYLALEINQHLGNLASVAQNYYTLSETYLKMGIPYKSIQYANKAYTISRDLGQIGTMQLATEIQYKAYKQMKNHEMALSKLEITQSLKDSIRNVQKSEDLANLRTNYEIEKQSMKIESLNKDKIIQDDRLKVQTMQRNVLVVVLTFLAIIASILFKNNRRKQNSNNMLTQKHQEIELKNNELARLNKEIVNQNASISNQKINLEELNHIKNNLFTIVSHDFRSPLKSIQGFLNLLSLGALTQEEMHKILEDLKDKVDMTADFLENLLTWARNQMQKIESKPVVITLKDIALENVSLLTTMASKKGVKLVVDIDEELEAYADLNMINLVVRNLVVNAIKFSSEGDSVKLSAKSKNNSCIFKVQDTGIGIDQEIINKIFELETYSTSGTANEKGSGLGLILCKDFVEKNNGTIWAESKVGKGSAFSFSIPLSPKNKTVAIPA